MSRIPLWILDWECRRGIPFFICLSVRQRMAGQKPGFARQLLRSWAWSVSKMPEGIFDTLPAWSNLEKALHSGCSSGDGVRVRLPLCARHAGLVKWFWPLRTADEAVLKPGYAGQLLRSWAYTDTKFLMEFCVLHRSFKYSGRNA